MVDWSSFFTYSLIAAIVLFVIGIYALITSKKFLKTILGIQFLLLSSVLLLLSFGFGQENGDVVPDSFAQAISILIICIGVAFLVIGLAINKKLQKIDGTILSFNFEIEEIIDTSELEGDNSTTSTQMENQGGVS